MQQQLAHSYVKGAPAGATDGRPIAVQTSPYYYNYYISAAATD
jgi:hypothetical protein